MKNGNTRDIHLTLTIECEMNKVDYDFYMTLDGFILPLFATLMNPAGDSMILLRVMLISILLLFLLIL